VLYTGVAFPGVSVTLPDTDAAIYRCSRSTESATRDILHLLEFLPVNIITEMMAQRAAEAALSKLRFVMKTFFVLGRPTCWKPVLIKLSHPLTHYPCSTTKCCVPIDT
jgi:hypothetical protein